MGVGLVGVERICEGVRCDERYLGREDLLSFEKSGEKSFC